MSRSFVIRRARVFDGSRSLGRMDVVVDGAAIRTVDAHVDVPPGTPCVDGCGKTLLPGLIDAHTHVFSRAQLGTALVFGVTTELDMANDYRLVAPLRDEGIRGAASDRADLRSAATPVTAANGHGTENTFRIPTIERPEEAASFVDARIAEGSDYIKIIYEDGAAYGFWLPTLGQQTIAAVVRAAHQRGRLAVAHISSLHGARCVLSAGIDGLVHLFANEPPAADFVRLAARGSVFVIPTLTVLESTTGVRTGVSLLADARLTPYLTTSTQSCLEMTFVAFPAQPSLNLAHAERAVRDLRDAGVTLLAGTDASNPGTAHGASLHRELELLVRAGLTPSEALAAATSAPARAFHLDDRGVIAPGRRADLLLVRGDPMTDITATRDIVCIWKNGVTLDRARAVRQGQRDEDDGPAGSADGLVSDFDDGSLRTCFGAGWMAVSDGIVGGRSRVEINVVEGGVAGGAGCLSIAGEIAAALPHPWAGVTFCPGDGPFAPANLSRHREIRFWARADDRREIAVALHHWHRGMHRRSRTVAVGAEWREYSLPFSYFGSDGRGLLSLLFMAGPPAGRFSMHLDDVRFA